MVIMIEKLSLQNCNSEVVDSFDCCFICGASQALWLLNSRPPNESTKQPFFPFLQYQIQPAAKASKLNSVGQCLSCNVCYILLMQQWKSYESRETPLMKRLYWMKRPPDEYSDILENSVNINPFVDENKQCEKISTQEPTSKNFQELLNKISTKNSKNIPQNTLKSDSNTFFSCHLCSLIDEKHLSCIVYTTPQESVDVPFFNNILYDKNKKKMEASGEKMLLCKQCSSNLHRQWVEFQEKSVPISERKYHINDYDFLKAKNKLPLCYICHNLLPDDCKYTLYCKKIPNEPFYPFLTNLKPEESAIYINSAGYTFCCQGCMLFLQKQWDVFEELDVPQEERVYRILQSQPPFVPSKVERDVACLLCNENNACEKMKRIYCNPGANMHPGATMNLNVTNFDNQNKEMGYYCHKTGETFVCYSCFENIYIEWIEKRDNFSNFKENAKTLTFDYDCKICLNPCRKLLELRVNLQDKRKPYFPVLKLYRDRDNGETVKGCEFCWGNLMTQWELVFQDPTADIIPDEFPFKLDSFLCGRCKTFTSRNEVTVQSIPSDDEKVTLVCRSCGDEKLSNKQQEYKINEKVDSTINNKQPEEEKEVWNESLDQSTCAEEEEEEEEVEEEDNRQKVDAEDETKEYECQAPDMKATATVPPFLNYSMRNHPQEHASTPPTSAAEGGFAAALRKLAQQAPGSFPSQLLPRDHPRHSPPLPGKQMKGDMSALMAQHSSGVRISGTPSIIAPPHPMAYPSADKQDLLLKTSYNYLHGRDHILPPHALPHNEGGKMKHQPPMVPGVFQYNAEREEHLRRQSQEKFENRNRESFEPNHHGPPQQSFEPNHHGPPQPPNVMALSSNPIKERPSGSIGLVHPQPARKHRDEEIVKSSAMNSLHFSPRDSVAVHSLSPTELSRYGSSFVTPRPHAHGPQSSCPVHGHEPHPHDERNNRPPNLPFDPAHGFHGLHGPHPRLREEVFLRRHSLERKEHVPPPPHHALEEDLRRRGLDYRGAFAGLPPHLLDEQYRRHLLNGSHEHATFKEPAHGQVYAPPHFYYGREYPVPVDPYHPHNIPTQNELLHRYGAPPVSPRLIEPYRRNEHSVIHNSSREYEAERRFEERRDKERENGRMMRSPSIESLKKMKNEEMMIDRRKPNYTVSLEKKPVLHEKEKQKMKMPIFKGLECNNNIIKQQPKPNGTSHQANSISSLLSTKLPSSKSELDAASILANMNRINQSPCSDELESVSSSGPEIMPSKPPPIKIEDKENIEMEQPEEKLNYLMTIGLVSHSRKRALEDEYERKRWDRKFRKYRGRPKKRSKRENTEESSLNGDTRPGSELDFYNGPMTRHKQQLLQEQESLLEQIQKRNSTDTNENNITEGCTTEPNNTGEEQSSVKSRQSPRNSPRKDSTSKSNEDTGNDQQNGEKDDSTSNEHSAQLISSRKLIPMSLRDSPANSNSINNQPSSSEIRNNTEHSGRLMALLRDNPSGQQNSSRSSPVERNGKFPPEHFHHQQQSHSQHDHAKRHSTNSNSFGDHVTRPPTNSNAYVDHIEEVKMLDNSLFGRNMEHTPEHYVRWPGVNYVHHAYSSYLKECDMQRQHLLQSYEELQRESRCLHQKRDYLEKDMLVYNERRMRIAERRRNMQMAMEGVHQTLRSMSNL